MARLGLTQLPRKLAEHTGQAAPTYRRCFDAAVEARIPAEFSGSRWSVDEADVPQIAVAMGLSAPKAVTPTPKGRKAARDLAAA